MNTIFTRFILFTATLTMIACGGSSTNNGCGAPAANCVIDSMADYRITFTSTWASDRHPGNFPSGAHFSPWIGTAHKTPDRLWTRDGSSIASNGIELMAETGSTSTLRTEIEGYISNGEALQIIQASGLGAETSTDISITLSKDFPLLSLTSMIAPSPDWFVGIRNINLRENDDWIETLTIDLVNVYDAGTDSGPTFTSDDAEVTPHLPIRLVSDEGNHFLATPLPLVTITITRIADVI